jgi:hypothetical protein
MKISILGTLLLVAMLASGCALFHHNKAQVGKPAPSTVATTKMVVTPDNSFTARVASYNATGRFVVLSFPVGQMPGVDQTLFLYRNGLKVAEVKVTGPQRDNNIVADLDTGDAQAGDEVRDQ